jgi:hypothetical protein
MTHEKREAPLADAPKGEKAGTASKVIPDLFVLERIFPSPADLLASHQIVASSPDVLVSTTNALLLPYEIDAGNLNALGSVYQALA